jgi:3'-phosphoadenosine 5'-phosphosulfate sulfotransferase (PAPS reductase)/FAD synthetase
VNLALVKSASTVGTVALRERLLRMRAETANANSRELLDFAIRREFPGRIAVISSFAAESVVLLHQVAEIDPQTPVLFLNTGKLFGETLRHRDRLQETLGLTDIRCMGPHPVDREKFDPKGRPLESRSRRLLQLPQDRSVEEDACGIRCNCHRAKTIPDRRARQDTND